MTESENLQRREPNFITVSREVPAVTFSADVTNGTVPLTVKLTDATPGMAAYLHTWDFGDGQQETVNQVPWIWHTYTAAGDYTVTLTIQAPSGAISGVEELHPRATAGPARLVQCDSTHGRRAADGLLQGHDAKCRWLPAGMGFWRWDDLVDLDPVHTYVHAGSYTVTLTLRNAYGATATGSQLISPLTRA